MALTPAARPDLRAMLLFAAVAVVGGGALFAVSTLAEPGEPFLLAGVYLGLALPALVLTRLTGGPTALRTLLRRCVRAPRAWWWLPVAGLAVPLASSALAGVLDGARPVNASSVAFYLTDLLVGVVVVNLAEELGWTGFFQSRAMRRWGAVGGSLVTAVFFTLIHVPLAVDGVPGPTEAVRNVLLVGAAAVGLRLLVGRLHAWTGGSILAVGVLHSSFNATESLLDPAYDWVRIVTVVGLAVVAVTVTGRPLGGGSTGGAVRRGVTEGPDLRVHAERSLRVAVR